METCEEFKLMGRGHWLFALVSALVRCAPPEDNGTRRMSAAARRSTAEGKR